MKLFKENKKSQKALLFSIVVVIIIISIFINALSNATKNTESENLIITQNAIKRALVNCYAIEGIYPESIKYIEDNYGVIIDHDKYIVSYDTVGSNVLPYVQVLQKGIQNK